VHPEFAANALWVAERDAREYAAAEGLDLSDVFLVSSHLSPTFAGELAARLGVAAGSFVALSGANDVQRDPHSSAMTWGYHRAIESGLVPSHRTILFVAAASGMTTACAAYRR
jgi:3-oxoacyl-[acyl-carrier-protein] synthase-3